MLLQAELIDCGVAFLTHTHPGNPASLPHLVTPLTHHLDQSDPSHREAPWLNRSLDVLEAGQPPIPRAPLPYKAYNYSSDEDDFDDDHSDYFPTSAAGMPPPPPPRSASYGLDMRPSCPTAGLVALHHSLGEGQGSHDNLTGSKHSLGEWGGGPAAGWGGSRGSLGLNGDVSGGASPVMDDLDNLLMNQSLQHSAPPHEHHLSDETSEGSTCRAAHQPHNLHQQQQQHRHPHQHQPQESHKKSHHLNRFASAVRHLQKHVVEIDQAVLAMTGEVGGTRHEVTALKEAVSALQSDTHTITTTLSSLTQQAITVQHKITQATQEAEHVQQAASVALREAEQARQEQLRIKQEYEDLVGEVRSTLYFLKDSYTNRKDSQDTGKDLHSLGQNSQVAEKDSKCAGKDSKNDSSTTEEGGRSGTSFVASLGGSRGSGGSWTGPVLVSKSSSPSQKEKTVPAYQSLFSRSSSIISGLTSRHSLTKAVSFADQKNKKKSDGAEGKSSSLERWREDKPMSHQERTSKEEKSLLSLDKRDKDSKRQGSVDQQDKKDKHQRSLERKQKDGKHGRERGSKQEKRDAVISGLSDDDIPMADDTSHEVIKVAPTKVSTSMLTLNFSLGKSSSTPTVSYVSAASIPRTMQTNRDRQSSELSISNASLDSPTAPSPYSRPGSGILPPVEESPPASEAEAPTGPLLHRPGSTPGPLARQGSMTTVPEDRVVSGPPTTKRSGVFAISRQHSSPNIPLQRQGSSPMFPLQRQGSLGLVPESRLPRQESLTSVPENRAVVDRTLPLSPSPSMTYVPLSPSASSSVVSESVRQAARESMELVTGAVLAGSSMQEAAATGTLPVLCLSEEDQPAATSTLKKDHKRRSNVVGILV
ncbi:hypothetical protein Pmani_026738 [Petrolisthes manimaculis]|uniref:Uncharacterized protein n=1 Tax=Petrolisthes manimaculis TaxID=1843537 RepID=A0AAE1P5L1_9EUCA|nr:hypothetical protein Pmani_026738 [Petrolisthes manimaculis]